MRQLLLVFAVTSALEILVYQPLLMPSHVKFMGRLVDVLVDNGHNVTVLVSAHRPDVAHGCDRANEILTFTSEETVAADIKPDLGWVTVATPASQWQAMKPLGVPLGKQCKSLLNNEVLLHLRGRHFDVLIHEVFDMCGLALMLSLNLEKHVIVSSTRQMDTVGYELGLLSPMRDAAILSDYGSEVPWSAVFRNADFIRSYIKFTDIQQEFYKKELKSLNFTRNLNSLIRGASAVFLNTHPLADTWRSSLRNVYDIGGIGLQQATPLNSDLASFLAKWKKIVLISFGTVVPSAYMPTAWKQNVRNVIRSLPEVLFLWKYEETDEFFAEYQDNILFSPFFPQNDLLGSGYINLFITHGGQNSVLEAANTGVPMLVVPQFGDQNAKAVEERNLGKVFNKQDLGNFNMVKSAITEILAQRFVQNSKVAGAIAVEVASREFVSRLMESVRSPLTFEEGPAPIDVLALFDFGWMVVCTASAITVASFSIAVVYNTLLRRHLSQEKAHQS